MHHLAIDLTGQTFGRLTAIRPFYAEWRSRRTLVWEFECSCGGKTIATAADVRNGHTKSCGCFNLEKISQRRKTHGETGSIEYDTWQSAITRCYNTRRSDYKDYGGRGILMDSELRSDFSAFLNEVGRRPSSKHSIDRIDNNKGYVRGNLRWATPKQQANNRRNSKHP
jgi:hypothetical protein